jgi:hypothetical protein
MKPIALSNSLCLALGITPSAGLPERHGQVCLANDSLIEQATYREEVTTFGIGYADPLRNQLAGLRDFLAPRRPAGRNAIVTQYDEDQPFEVVDYKKVLRNPGADFAEVKQRTSTKVSRLIPNRGLTVRLDRDQLKEKPNWENMHAQWLIDMLIRASILQGLALASAAAVTDTFTWDSNANPDLDLKNVMVNILAPAVGFKPNRALYGEAATLQRQIAYESQDTAGAFARAALMSDDQLATALGVDRVRTNAERYNNASGNKVTFLGSKVLLFTGVDGESPEDPSNLVRHVAQASYGGGEYAVYITEQGVKTVFITVENYELPVVQHTTGLMEITIQ